MSRGPERCAWDGCEQPLTSFSGDYAVQIPNSKETLRIQRVCTSHAVWQLQRFATQTLWFGWFVVGAAVLVSLAALIRGRWDLVVFPLTLVLVSRIGFSGRRKYDRIIRQLLDQDEKNKGLEG